MKNSWQQAHNLDGVFGIRIEHLHKGPVILVDDMVDSRWTITVVTAGLRRILQQEGIECPAVMPLALALNSLSAH